MIRLESRLYSQEVIDNEPHQYDPISNPETMLVVNMGLDNLQPASKKAESRRSSHNTGFEEPFDHNRNTTLRHPDADTGPNPIIETEPLLTTRHHSWSRFLHPRHHSVSAYGKITEHDNSSKIMEQGSLGSSTYLRVPRESFGECERQRTRSSSAGGGLQRFGEGEGDGSGNCDGDGDGYGDGGGEELKKAGFLHKIHMSKSRD